MPKIRNYMKKNFLKLLLIVLLTVLALSLFACTPTNNPVTPDGGDGDVDDTDTPTPVTFSVTFDSKGGTGIEGYTDVEFGQCVPAPSTNPTKTGYIFDGWTLSNGDPVDFDAYTVYSNVTFFASWKAKTYDITARLTDEGRKDFILDVTSDTVSEYFGDIFSVANSDLEQKDVDGVSTWTASFSLSYESTNASSQSLPVPKIDKSGDRFLYWYYYKDGAIVPLTSTHAQGSTKETVALLNGYNIDGPLTVYAMWYSTLDNVTVKFNPGRDDVSISINDVRIKDGDHLSMPTTPTANGFDFDKWTYILTDEEGEETFYDMAFYLDPSSHGTHVTMDMTTEGVFNLYAHWTKHIDISSASDWLGLDMTDKDVQNANIYITQNIQLDDYTTIFNSSNPFCGVLDGQGNTITMSVLAGIDGCYALVGVNEGVIKSLNISASEIVIADDVETGVVYAGMVAGISKGTISAVSVELSFIQAYPTNANSTYIGGIAGVNYGEISNVKITNFSISATGNIGYIGGVVGDNGSGFITTATIANMEISSKLEVNGHSGLVAGRITYGDCTKIVASDSTVDLSAGKNAYAGGIAGLVNNNKIEECSLANCTVAIGAHDVIGANAYAGGIVGKGGSAIRNMSISAITVNATSNSLTVAGGIAGINFCESGNRGQIQYTVATGSVNGKSAGKIYVGGFCGQQNAGTSSSNGALAYVYGELNVTATRLTNVSEGEETPEVTVKIGKAFGSCDKTTNCQNVYLADSSTINVDSVEYDKEAEQYPVTTHVSITEITPGFETIQNATWLSRQLKLDTNTWVLTDGSYPSLVIAM